MQNLILKFIFLISSLLSINTALAIPLSSVISTDTQQVEYTQYSPEVSLFILHKLSKEQLAEVVSSEHISGTFLDSVSFTHSLDYSFKLYKDSLLLINTLITQQKYQIQKLIFKNIVETLHVRLINTLHQVENLHLNA